MRWLKYGGMIVGTFVATIAVLEFVTLLVDSTHVSRATGSAGLAPASVVSLGLALGQFIDDHRRVPTSVERSQWYLMYTGIVVVIVTIIYAVARVSGTEWLSSLLASNGRDLEDGYWINLLLVIAWGWLMLLILPRPMLKSAERRRTKAARRREVRR